MSPRILIFGTGSIGSVYTYLLSRQVPASNLVCVCRSNYSAIRENGITINSTLWGKNLKVQPTVVHDVAEASSISTEPFDYIIITAKALKSTPSTAEMIKSAVGPHTAIVLIQNGIGIEEPYSTLYPSNSLLSTVVYLPATQTSPGIVSHSEVELLHVGLHPPSSESTPEAHSLAARTFMNLLKSCSATAKFHQDIQAERWSKLVVNATWNPICALTRSRDAEFLKASQLSTDEKLSYIRDVMLEIANIAQACGYDKIDEETVDFQIGRAKKRDLPGVEPSMLADARGGRRMEVDAIVGNALSIAREKGVRAPMLRAIYVLLSALDGSFERATKSSD